ncbi:hypothetical protein L6248_00185 [Candidatus Parcubacteria bacterium]|nr:hypothetical protein [Candidatus Parcubacteria bacterium]
MWNNIIDIIFLPMLFFIGAKTSWDDFRCGKIKNKWIILGIVYGAAALICLLVLDFTVEEIYITPLYFLKVFINSLAALLAGYLLWRYGLWAAGDAKLFFVFSLLLPLEYYWKSYFPHFPSFVLLINIFVLVFIIIFFKASFFALKFVFQFLKNKPKININKIIIIFKKNADEFLKIFLIFTAIFIIMLNLTRIAADIINPGLLNESFLLLFLFLLYRFIFSIVKKSNFLFGLTLLLLTLYLAVGLFFYSEETISQLSEIFGKTAKYMAIILFLIIILDYYIKKTALISVKAEELAPGMSLAINDKKFNKKNIGTIFGGGLAKNQVEFVKEWARKNKITEIKIYQRFPFAFWMFLGLLITILLKGGIVYFVFNLISTLR